jgi:hypothetical protein
LAQFFYFFRVGTAASAATMEIGYEEPAAPTRC